MITPRVSRHPTTRNPPEIPSYSYSYSYSAGASGMFLRVGEPSGARSGMFLWVGDRAGAGSGMFLGVIDPSRAFGNLVSSGGVRPGTHLLFPGMGAVLRPADGPPWSAHFRGSAGENNRDVPAHRWMFLGLGDPWSRSFFFNYLITNKLFRFGFLSAFGSPVASPPSWLLLGSGTARTASARCRSCLGRPGVVRPAFCPARTGMGIG